jgi:hypothetical protein
VNIVWENFCMGYTHLVLYLVKIKCCVHQRLKILKKHFNGL